MLKSRLVFDEMISKLETNNMWRTAADTVYDAWKMLPNDINCLLCAGTQLWYTIYEMDYIRNDPFPPTNVELVSEIQLQNRLMEVTRYGFKHFRGNSLFNAYFGYMISAMPYYFLDYNGDYLGWKKKGIEMMRYAYKIDPGSSLTKAMYYEPDAYNGSMDFLDACKELWTQITPEQWGNSAVQQYFFRILHGDLFYSRTGDGLREP